MKSLAKAGKEYERLVRLSCAIYELKDLERTLFRTINSEVNNRTAIREIENMLFKLEQIKDDFEEKENEKQN